MEKNKILNKCLNPQYLNNNFNSIYSNLNNWIISPSLI